jgi:hypothetical protein
VALEPEGKPARSNIGVFHIGSDGNSRSRSGFQIGFDSFDVAQHAGPVPAESVHVQGAGTTVAAQPGRLQPGGNHEQIILPRHRLVVARAGSGVLIFVQMHGLARLNVKMANHQVAFILNVQYGERIVASIGDRIQQKSLARQRAKKGKE